MQQLFLKIKWHEARKQKKFSENDVFCPFPPPTHHPFHFQHQIVIVLQIRQ